MSHVDRVHRRPSEDRFARFASLSVAVGLHFIFTAFLFRDMHAPDDGIAKKQNVIRITFIEPRPSPQELKVQPIIVARERATVWVESQNTTRRMRPAPAASDSRRRDAPFVPGLRLNLSIAPVDIDFQRNPVKPIEPRLQPSANWLRIRVLDRSLGGRLKAMTRYQICRELRLALLANAGSAAQIVAAMEQNGCAI